MIDTHAHLFWSDFDADLPAVLERARESGVSRVITVALDKETGQKCLEIAAAHPDMVAATIGVHPSDVQQATEDDLLWVEAQAGDQRVVAIGEIGLDYYRGETNTAQQEALLERMLNLARQLNLPAIIHHRKAGTRTLEIIRQSGVSRGVFHCFSEWIEFAREALDLGFHISFTGNITYAKSRLPEVAKFIPLERLLLETDAPFMPPVPYRGKRCEPRMVREVAMKLAEIKQVDFETVDRITTEAAIKLFFS
jgi:TatD DNase family protein